MPPFVPTSLLILLLPLLSPFLPTAHFCLKLLLAEEKNGHALAGKKRKLKIRKLELPILTLFFSW